MKEKITGILAALLLTAVALPAPPEPPFALALDFYRELAGSREPEHTVTCAFELAGRLALGGDPWEVDCDDIVDWYFDAVARTGDEAAVMEAMAFGLWIYKILHSWQAPGYP